MLNQPWWFDDEEVGDLVLVEGGEHVQVLGGEVTLMIMMTMMMNMLNMVVTIIMIVLIVRIGKIWFWQYLTTLNYPDRSRLYVEIPAICLYCIPISYHEIAAFF